MKHTDQMMRIDKEAYKLARAFLSNLKISGVTDELIKKYLDPLSQRGKPATKNEIYKRILESAQNTSRKSAVIGNAIDGIDNLSKVLYNFDPQKVLSTYQDWKAVLKSIKATLKPRGKIRTAPQSAWPTYCKTILSAATFIEQFSSPKDFFEWVDSFDRDGHYRAGLPMLLSHEIEGLGFALSCDFLKEMGYVQFPKPDIHLREIFTSLELCSDDKKKGRDYQLFKAIVRLAKNAGVTPYNADKVFWLIASGNFYNDPDIGKIGRRKKEFICYAKPLLAKQRKRR